MKVLAVGAHPDDVELGCGATLARHAITGDEVFVVVAGYGRDSSQRDGLNAACRALGVSLFAAWNLPDQRLDAIPRLDLTQRVEEVLRRLDPELVFTHYKHDRNLDHRVVYDAVMTACRPYGVGSSVRDLLSFEVPSSTEWGDETFPPSLYVHVAGLPMERKLSALECYPSEMRSASHPRSRDYVQALALVRGSASGLSQAEAFVPVRMVR